MFFFRLAVRRGEKETPPKSRHAFDVSFWACQTGFFKYEHPFIDKPMVITEPAVRSTKRTAIRPGFKTVS